MSEKLRWRKRTDDWPPRDDETYFYTSDLAYGSEGSCKGRNLLLCWQWAAGPITELPAPEPEPELPEGWETTYDAASLGQGWAIGVMKDELGSVICFRTTRDEAVRVVNAAVEAIEEAL